MIWDTAPLELKELTSVVALKKSIKEWKPNCSCRLSKKGYVTIHYSHIMSLLTFYLKICCI